MTNTLEKRAREIAIELYTLACDDANGNGGVMSYGVVSHIEKALIAFAEEAKTSMIDLDKKIFDSKELSGSDIEFLSSVTSEAAKARVPDAVYIGWTWSSMSNNTMGAFKSFLSAIKHSEYRVEFFRLEGGKDKDGL